jgi:hypothetical protein
MQDATVLDVDPIADADGVYITTKYGVEPNAAIVSQCHIAY